MLKMQNMFCFVLLEISLTLFLVQIIRFTKMIALQAAFLYITFCLLKNNLALVLL